MLTESSRYNLGVAFSRSYRGHINRQVQNSDRINSDRLIRVGSTRINPDRPGSTWIDLNYNTIKEKGYYYAFIMKI